MHGTKDFLHAVVILIAISFLSCQAQKKAAHPDEWKGNALWFGSGGGFTGLSTTYCLLENGQLFEKAGGVNSSFKPLYNISRKQALDIFKNAASLPWPKQDINEPGNMYSEIAYGKTGAAVRLVWSGKNAAVDPKIASFHQQLFSLIKNKP